MKFSRRKFLVNSLITTTGVGLLYSFNQYPENIKKKKYKFSADYSVSEDLEPDLIHRFIVIGDPHYAEPSKSSTQIIGVDDRTGPPIKPINHEETAQNMVNALKLELNKRGLDFFIINGDVQKLAEEFRDKYLKQVGVPFYVTNGNHDRLTNDSSINLWGHPLNYVISFGDYACILLDSSGESGARQACLGEDFLRTALNEHKDKKGIFLISHIARFSGGFRENPIYESPECENILKLLRNSKNFICGVHSHFHEEARIIYKDGMPFCFTGRYGGSYGVPFYGYRIFEIYDNGAVRTMLYNHTDDEIVVLANDPTTFFPLFK